VEIAIEPIAETAEPEAEIVERKGLGHPDSICDALAEEWSLALSRHYLERHGAILHHNVDKALLVGGAAEPRFGGGRVLEPIVIYLAGRAITDVGGVAVPVAELALGSARAWLRANLRGLDVERNVQIHPVVRRGSVELVDLFGAGGPSLANDTSLGVGFAPLSRLEALVLGVEQHLTSRALRSAFPALGEDVKVMGMRRSASFRLTVAAALVDRHLPDAEAYRAARSRVAEEVRAAARGLGHASLEVEVNGADDDARGRFYATVTGLSAEAGDDGQPGRGNRVNGLITPRRAMTLESVAGKNPVTHVGKLYNIAASLLAEELVAELPGVAEAECRLVSRIGRRVDDPPLLHLRVRSVDPGQPAPRARIEEIARQRVAEIPSLWRPLLAGEIALDRWPLRRPVRESARG
jgi:S-adenosylmethionine synthetase